MSKKKNKQKHVPWGRTLSTNDKYLPGGNKTGSNKNRGVIVVDNNAKGDLGVAPLRGSVGDNRRKYGHSYVKDFFEICDNENKPIRVNEKFRENHKNMDYTEKEVETIRQDLFQKSKQRQRNKKLYDKFHKDDWL